MTQPWVQYTNFSMILQAKSKFFLYCILLSVIQLQNCQKLCGRCTRQLHWMLVKTQGEERDYFINIQWYVQFSQLAPHVHGKLERSQSNNQWREERDQRAYGESVKMIKERVYLEVQEWLVKYMDRKRPLERHERHNEVLILCLKLLSIVTVRGHCEKIPLSVAQHSCGKGK